MQEMSQLYSRVFLQILDSSIAEDFSLRHVFEDFLKLADHKTGVVDMTRPALSRRLNIPLDLLEQKIKQLESPDPASRDNEFDGRRIERLDGHRDWGWKILNWGKYEAIRNRADVYMRVAKHRENEKEKNSHFPVKVEDAVVHAEFIGCSKDFAAKVWTKAEGRGGCDAKDVPIRSFRHYLQTEWSYEQGRLQKLKPKRRESMI